MRKSSYMFAVLALLLGSVATLHAQTGCEDSPENPTVILAGMGAAGFAVSYLRGRFNSRLKK